MADGAISSGKIVVILKLKKRAWRQPGSFSFVLNLLQYYYFFGFKLPIDFSFQEKYPWI